MLPFTYESEKRERGVNYRSEIILSISGVVIPPTSTCRPEREQQLCGLITRSKKKLLSTIVQYTIRDSPSTYIEYRYKYKTLYCPHRESRKSTVEGGREGTAVPMVIVVIGTKVYG